MVTRGDVSLDVEDNRGPDDWPYISDISTDMLRYSVHLPLDPRQKSRWPGGEETSDITDGGVVRILNVVVEECRTLSSRERCPYLVHVEVAETGLTGTDSRLYASGAPGLGTTVKEALSLSASATSGAVAGDRHPAVQGYAPYQIPSELLETSPAPHKSCPTTQTQDVDLESTDRPTNSTGFVRGGWRNDETMYYSPDAHGYDEVRQNEFEQLHQQMHDEQGVMAQPPPVPHQQR
jgi:hypothetical protein